MDVTVYLNGYHGDTSKTFLVGDVVRTPTSKVSTHWYIYDIKAG